MCEDSERLDGIGTEDRCVRSGTCIESHVEHERLRKFAGSRVLCIKQIPWSKEATSLRKLNKSGGICRSGSKSDIGVDVVVEQFRLWITHQEDIGEGEQPYCLLLRGALVL